MKGASEDEMMEQRKSPKSRVERIVATALPVAAIVMICYQLLHTQYILQGPAAHKISHLGLAFIVVLLSLIKKERIGRPLRWILLFVSIGFSGYLMYYLNDIQMFRQPIPLPSDIVVGVIVLITVFIVAYQVLGKTFVIIAGACFTHLVLGRYFPHPFTVAPVSFTRIIM